METISSIVIKSVWLLRGIGRDCAVLTDSCSSSVSDLRLSPAITLLIRTLMGQSAPCWDKSTLLCSSQLHIAVVLTSLILCKPLVFSHPHYVYVSGIFSKFSLTFLSGLSTVSLYKRVIMLSIHVDDLFILTSY